MKRYVFFSQLIAVSLLCGCAPQYRIEGQYLVGDTFHAAPGSYAITFYPDSSYVGYALEPGYKEVGSWRVIDDSLQLTPRLAGSFIRQLHPAYSGPDAGENAVDSLNDICPHLFLEAKTHPFRIVSSRKILFGEEGLCFRRNNRRCLFRMGHILQNGYSGDGCSKGRVQQTNLRFRIVKAELMREPWNGGEERFAVVNLVRNGLAVRYDSMGRRRLEFCYADNMETGPFTAYDTEGRVTCSGNLINGRYDGKIIFYHPDGTIRAVDSYRLGQKDGICEEYTPEGQPGRKTLYRKGKFIREVQ